MGATPLPRTLQFASMAVLLALAAACTESSRNPTTPTPPAPSVPVYYTAIGASDATGVGGTILCPLFGDCPDGTGYVPVIARRLKQGREVTLMNLGIPASVIGPDIQAIGVRYGRTIPGNFLDQEAPFVPRETTLVTVFAGGNDANAIGAAIEGGAGATDPRGYADAQIRAFAADYVSLIDIIRQRAPSARIVAANLPNFAGVPFTANYSLQRKQMLQKLTVGFSQQGVNALTSRGVIVVDLLCDPRAYTAAQFSSDGFHPNDAGYAYLADVYLAAINATTPPRPAVTCPQMTLVPPI
jgi:lysophospholipase L1-like esterase